MEGLQRLHGLGQRQQRGQRDLSQSSEALERVQGDAGSLRQLGLCQAKREPPLARGVRRPQGLLRPRRWGFGDLPGLFGDSLPDGWGRLLIDRNLAARGRARTDITDLDRLAMVGTGVMGALVYRPEEAPDTAKDISLDWFDRLVPSVGEETSAYDLKRLRAMAGGSQGARPKFVAQLTDDGTRLRDHRLPLVPGWRAVLV